MQIIVLGMHRAGTSAVTGLINLMGAYLTPEEQLLPATPDNPKGYWERIDVLQLHEFVLERLDADWDRVSAVDMERVGPELRETFMQRARGILQDLNGHRPWVMKDPRLCLLLPLWRPLLDAPVCVHVARHPLAVAHSLAVRDDFPLHFGITLWEHYNACALTVSSGLPRFSVCYEALMAQPVKTVRTLYETLCRVGVSSLRLPTELEIETFLQNDLQHHRALEQKDDPQWLTPNQILIWEALRESKLELSHEILAAPPRIVQLATYETLLQERSELLRQRDSLVKKNADDLQSLRRLFETLHHDVQVTFESLTWRVGFAIAEMGRKLGLLRRTFLVQDHLAHIARHYQSWLSRQYSPLTEENFDEKAYLAQYPDVRAAIERGDFASGFEHFELRGRDEIASGNRIYIPGLLSKDYQNYQKPVDLQKCRKEIVFWLRQPLISVIVPVYNVEARWLEAAIQSVKQQVYSNWQICIADDGSTQEETTAFLRQIDDRQIRIEFLDSNRGIAGASNAALALAEGEYIAFLDHDDELTPDALYHVVKAINEHDPDLIYSDEDKLSLEGDCLGPHFKPDYSPDLILSNNYICHLSVYRKTLLDQLAEEGRYVREGFEGSQDHDLVLRALDYTDRIHHIPRVLYHWRMIPGSTAAEYSSKHYAWEAGRRAIEDTLRRRKIAGEALLSRFPGTYRVRRAIQGQPLISILIPFHDHPDLLRQCIDSIMEKTTYANFEVLGVSNNSEEPETFALMERYAADERICFLHHNVPFNYAAINNFVAKQARGEHLVLLNNDTVVITPDWLETLLEHSQRPEVGAVGAKLCYPDNTVQHGGVIIGVGGIAGHAHRHLEAGNPGYFARLQVIQNLSAVTAACLMIKKSLYEVMHGMDEQHLAVAFNDVDLCLRLREQGYLNVFTPFCELYHHESKTRGYEDTPQKKQRFIQEIAYIRKRHAGILEKGDPYYNINLPLDRDDFGIL